MKKKQFKKEYNNLQQWTAGYQMGQRKLALFLTKNMETVYSFHEAIEKIKQMSKTSAKWPEDFIE